jgi:peptidyl-prolyl cis-trans isomerase A (cyclophilin A)
MNSLVAFVFAPILLAFPGDPPMSEAKPAGRPATTQPASDPRHPRVALETTMGTIVLELDAEKAPDTTANFLQYVESRYYEGTIFHRVIPNFMIQGGGFVSLTQQKSDGLRKPIQNEARNGLKNQRGTIAMARTADPHSATAQFFINVVDNAMLDYPGRDGWGYCVFGKVVEGMDVVDKIKSVQTRQNPMMPGENSQPVDPPVIKSARKL